LLANEMNFDCPRGLGHGSLVGRLNCCGASAMHSVVVGGDCDLACIVTTETFWPISGLGWLRGAVLVKNFFFEVTNAVFEFFRP
jgi:hypothetical protein